CGRVGVFLSGGLDSGAIASTSCQLVRGQARCCDILAFTTIWDGFDRNEGYYAGLTAAALDIPIQYRDFGADATDPARWLASGAPEPVWDPTSVDSQYYRAISTNTRVCFFGEGPDNALDYEWKAYLARLVRERNYLRLTRDVLSHVLK